MLRNSKREFKLKAVAIKLTGASNDEYEQEIINAVNAAKKYNVDLIQERPSRNSFIMYNYYNGKGSNVAVTTEELFDKSPITLIGVIGEVFTLTFRQVVSNFVKEDGSPLTKNDFKFNKVLTIKTKPGGLVYSELY